MRLAVEALTWKKDRCCLSFYASQPALRCKEACKSHLILTVINPGSWKQLVDDRSSWHKAIQEGVIKSEKKPVHSVDKEENSGCNLKTLDRYSRLSTTPANEVCHGKVVMLSNSRRCSQKDWITIEQGDTINWRNKLDASTSCHVSLH